MQRSREKLGRRCRIRAHILLAHLDWAAKRFSDVPGALAPHLDAALQPLVAAPPKGDRDTVLFSELVAVDRAIAAAAGGDPEPVYLALGAESARLNIGAAYDKWQPEQPHVFFLSMSTVHRAFQDFGKSRYERLGDRSGRCRITRYSEFSPVFCVSGCGYYEEALRMMKAPGPIVVRETQCFCAGDEACVFDLGW